VRRRIWRRVRSMMNSSPPNDEESLVNLSVTAEERSLILQCLDCLADKAPVLQKCVEFYIEHSKVSTIRRNSHFRKPKKKTRRGRRGQAIDHGQQCIKAVSDTFETTEWSTIPVTCSKGKTTFELPTITQTITSSKEISTFELPHGIISPEELNPDLVDFLIDDWEENNFSDLNTWIQIARCEITYHQEEVPLKKSKKRRHSTRACLVFSTQIFKDLKVEGRGPSKRLSKKAARRALCYELYRCDLLHLGIKQDYFSELTKKFLNKHE